MPFFEGRGSNRGGGSDVSSGAMNYWNQIPDTVRGILEPYMTRGQGGDEAARSAFNQQRVQYEQMPDLYGTPGTNVYAGLPRQQRMASNPEDFMNSIMRNYSPSEGYRFREGRMLGAARNSAASGGFAGTPYDQEQQSQMVRGLMGEDMQQYLNNVLGIQSGGQNTLERMLSGRERHLERANVGRENALSRLGAMEHSVGERGSNAALELARSLASNLQQQGGLAFQQGRQDLADRNQRRSDRSSSRNNMFSNLLQAGGTLAGFLM